MASKKISQLPPASSVSGNSLLAIVNNNVTEKVTISQLPLGITTVTNLGTGDSLGFIAQNELKLKTLIAGIGLSFTTSFNSVTLNTVFNVNNVGSGTSLINTFTNPNLALKSITGSGNITITDNTTSINIASTPVTASSSGSGTSLIDSFTNSNLALKSITGSNGIIITNNTTSIDIANSTTTNFAQILAIGMLKC